MNRFILFTALLAQTGCGNYHDSLKAEQDILASGSKTMSFAATEALVLGPSCTGCHSQRSKAGGINLETYAGVLPFVAQIRAAVASDAMPLGGPALESAQKSVLFAWIDAGAPEVSNNPLTAKGI